MTTVTCILGFLARGANATVQLTVKVRTPGIVTNTASVSSATSDPNPSNDSATVSTSIR